MPKDFNTTVDAEGNTWIYLEGDLSVAPSGCMPSGRYFFDCVVSQEPIDEEILVRDGTFFKNRLNWGWRMGGTFKSDDSLQAKHARRR